MLRYADRLKERSNVAIKPMKYNPEQFTEASYEDLKPEPDFKPIQKLENPNYAKNAKNGHVDIPEKDNKHQKPETNLPIITHNQKQA